MQVRQVQFKMYPTRAQGEVLETWNRLHCELYNACLQERRDAYRKKGISLSYYDQQDQLPAVKEARSEFKALGSQALQETVRRVDRAFQAFFRRVKAGQTPGYPRFKASRSYVGFCYPAKSGWAFELGDTGKHGKLNITNLGVIKLRGKPRQWGEARQLTLSKIAGQWYATITIRCEVIRTQGSLQAGIDLGTSRVASLSDGTQTENPRFLKQSAKRIATLNRELARRKKFGQNWKRTKLRLAHVSAGVARQRSDFQHKLTADLVATYGILATEELNIKNMTAHGGAGKKGLNRSILDVGMAGILQKLEYKAIEAGTRLWYVPARKVKPSQTCPQCGHQKKKTLSERVHLCTECGYTADRDVAAAQVMLTWAIDNYSLGLAGGDGTGVLANPCEPRNPDQTAQAVGRG
ncbi:transposase (plasmid) [Deinococcus radiomollis]|uniref:RNA-guided endonuclease InsQ/TnpB family protein n=1 Tax=Deinococcus radiomollis TaxID=468916 RepID=UPI0038918FB1